jgi:hypothetical protein
LRASAKGKLAYQYLVQPKGMVMSVGYKSVNLNLDVASEIKQVLSNQSTAPPGATVGLKGVRYLTQRGYLWLKDHLSSRIDTRIYSDGDAAAKFLMADPIPLGDWLQAQTISGQDLAQLLAMPENQAFAQWLVPTMRQYIEHEATEKTGGSLKSNEKAEASGIGGGIQAGVIYPPVFGSTSFGMSSEDRRRALDSQWAAVGSKWGKGKSENEYIPIELTVYKPSEGTVIKQTSLTTSVSIGEGQSSSYIPYSPMSASLTPATIEKTLRRLLEENLGYRAEQHFDLINHVKSLEEQNRLLNAALVDQRKVIEASEAGLTKEIAKVAENLSGQADRIVFHEFQRFVKDGKQDEVVDFRRPVRRAQVFVSGVHRLRSPLPFGRNAISGQGFGFSAEVRSCNGSKVTVGVDYGDVGMDSECWIRYTVIAWLD